MRRIVALPAIALLAFVAGVGAEEKPAAKEQPKNAKFEAFKKLAGTWLKADKDGKPTDKVGSIFKVISAGTAVQETIAPGEPYEMVSVYHLDGPDLVMTHYCALGNQPKLKLDPNSPAGQFKFSFVGGTNLDSAKDLHMHEGSFTVIDDDHIETTWTAWSGGKPMDEHKLVVKAVRKK